MIEFMESHGLKSAPDADMPSRWLGSTQLLDLEDTKVRLRAQALTQLCKSDREKALALYAFVKRMPFAKMVKVRLQGARDVLDAGRGDATDKATLLVALLRAADIPARLQYIELRGEVLRGLTTGIASAGRPVVQLWLDGRWRSTDTYIFDAGYMDAARQRLKDQRWDWGYGLWVRGDTLWGASGDAFLGGVPNEDNTMVIANWGVYDDPEQLLSSPAWRARYPRLARAVQWNMLAPMMARVVRELRAESEAGPGARGPARSQF